MDPWQIAVLIWGLVISVAQAIGIIGGAAEKLAKLRKAAAAPNDTQNKRLDALELWQKEADYKLGRDYAAFRELAKANAVTLRSLLALLGHGLHGNNVAEMESAEKELKEYLTNHH